MAAIDFPSSPTLNQQFTAAGKTWVWDGARWDIFVSQALNTVLAVTNYTVAQGDDVVLVNGGGSTNILITLPLAASGNPQGVKIKNIGSGTVTITGSSGQLIDGQATVGIGVSLTSLFLIPYNNNWYIV